MSASLTTAASIPGAAKDMKVARALGSRRHRTNTLIKIACIAATALGLVLLASILFTLLWRGLSGLSLSVFTNSTKSPGSNGGLLKAIFGSLNQAPNGTAIGTPFGQIFGHYFREYGRGSLMANTVPFVSDVL